MLARVAVFEKGIRKAEKKKEYAGLCALEERVCNPLGQGLIQPGSVRIVSNGYPDRKKKTV